LITACLNTIKSQLIKILYPFVEASTESGTSLNPNPLLTGIIKNPNSIATTHRRQLGELFQALSAVIPRINNMVNAETVAMSDSIIIQAVYIAIGPFFVTDSGSEVDGGGKGGKKESVIIKTLGKSAMRGLRLDALSLIRSVCYFSLLWVAFVINSWLLVQIFANHEDQRSWIIEEILTSLIKLNDTKQKAGQFRLVMFSSRHLWVFLNPNLLYFYSGYAMVAQSAPYQLCCSSLCRRLRMMCALRRGRSTKPAKISLLCAGRRAFRKANLDHQNHFWMRMIRVFVLTFIIIYFIVLIHRFLSVPTGNSTLWYWSGFGDESREDNYYIPYSEVGLFFYEMGCCI